MRTIKVFIASSSELKKERMELVDLMVDLNDDKFEAEGFKLKSVPWEFMDSSMRAERKEDEYLAKLRECDICIVMFWNILGEYTVEELDVATEEMYSGRCPKEVHVFFKELAPNASDELILFKENFYNKYQLNPETFNVISSLRKQTESIFHTFIDKY